MQARRYEMLYLYLKKYLLPHMICLRKALKDILCVLQILQKVWGYSRPEISLVTCASGMSSGAMQSTSHDHTELAGNTVTRNSGFRRSISLRKKYGAFFDGMTRQETRCLYWNPYCNGFLEIQRKFWWFFESVGLQKRPHTLPVLTSIKKYICNIK